MRLATLQWLNYFYTASAVCVTILNTGSKFRLISNFTELHALAPAAQSYSYVLLLLVNQGSLSVHYGIAIPSVSLMVSSHFAISRLVNFHS